MMKGSKFIIKGLTTIGLTLIIIVIIFIVLISVSNMIEDMFRASTDMRYPFFHIILPAIMGTTRSFISQIMIGFGLIGVAQIIFLIINRKYN